MLDIRKIKENPDAVKAGLKAKEVDCDAIVDKILELDVQVRGLKTATETKTAQKNKLAKENGASMILTNAGDWNVAFFKKNGYLLRGELKDVPKGHNCYELYKMIKKIRKWADNYSLRRCCKWDLLLGWQ